jgi:hypothetical protein
MKSNSPVFQVLSLLMLFGPIVLFWYIDWYWIVGYYNLFFTYTCYVLYRQYDSDSNYRRKYHFIVYVGLPLIFSFIGLLISVLNGFEEIKEGDEDFNKNQFKTNNHDKEDNESKSENVVESKTGTEPKQNINKSEASDTKIKKNILELQDVRKLLVQLKENKIPIRFRSIWENYFYYQLKDESQKGFASESDHWDILNEYLDNYGIKKDYDKEKQLHYSYITYIEEKEMDYDQFIEESAIEDYIDACEKQDKDEHKGWVRLDFSYDDYLSWTVEEDFFNDPAAPGWLNSNNRDLIAPLNQANEEIKTEFSLDYKCFDDVIDFNFSEVNFKSQDHVYVFDYKLLVNNTPRNEKDLIQELGRIHESLDANEYEKKAFDLWRDFFLLKYDENEEKDGWEIGQEVNSVMFEMYEVDFVNFFYNHKDSGDTETMGIRFPFKYLENGKPALIHNFPFKYDQINAHSSGSFYQLDDVWGSLNEVCKSLSELEVIDFKKLSQKEKVQLFKPNRDDYS